jgi:hypothetical protein
MARATAQPSDAPMPPSNDAPTPLSDAPTPLSEEVQPAPPTLIDEYSGQGGSYTLDPATGIRILVQRTKPSAP